METNQIDIAVKHGAELSPDAMGDLREELQTLCARKPPIGGRGLANSDVRVYFTQDAAARHSFWLKLIVSDELFQQSGIGLSLRSMLEPEHPEWNFRVEIEPRDALNSIAVEVYHRFEFSDQDKVRVAKAIHQSFAHRFGAVKVEFVQHDQHDLWVYAKLPSWMHGDPSTPDKLHHVHRLLVAYLRGKNVRFTANNPSTAPAE